MFAGGVRQAEVAHQLVVSAKDRIKDSRGSYGSSDTL
jgi:hypothetical protein